MSVEGKSIAITGPTAGIGRSTALILAERGASLLLLCRSLDKGNALVEEIVAAGGSEPVLIHMDMADLNSVREAAAECLQKAPRLEILVNNAGVINTTRKMTVNGFEETMAVNHFAPFLLTGLLLPSLRSAPGARIVNVASDAHHFVRGIDFDDLHATEGFSTFRQYGRSKLANILFTRRLSSLLPPSEVTVNSLHPGAVSTSLGTQNGLLGKLLPMLLRPFFLSSEQGAQTTLYLCCEREGGETTGGYYVKSRLRSPKPWAQDDEVAARLWQVTEESVDFRYAL
ncbi:MAG: SDR family NAD(P)-dependent oxidoreductase [Pseudomonadota bacterium]